MIDPFTLIDLELPANSYKIECTKIWNFEEGENCASAISVDDTFGYYMNLFGSDMILFGSNFKFQESSVILLASLINFDVTNQALQVSFNFAVEDSMLVLPYEIDDIIFCELLVICEYISYMELNPSLSIFTGIFYLPF